MIPPPLIRGEPDPERAWNLLKIASLTFFISLGLLYFLWPFAEGKNLNNSPIANLELFLVGVVIVALLTMVISLPFAALKFFIRNKPKSD